MRAQLAVNLDRTPIEDAAVDWSEEVSPFQPLGKIVLPPQDADSQARRDYAQDTSVFQSLAGARRPPAARLDHAHTSRRLPPLRGIAACSQRLAADDRTREISEFPD